MEFTYCLDQKRIQVFAGKLSRDVILVPEKNELLWTDLDRDFCDSSIYANAGYIGHVLANIKYNPDSGLFDSIPL
jgi:8-oxo-dGTP diphosphatase